MSLPMLVIGFVVVLGPLLFFHELGHFLVARQAGIRVLEFGFGFPPRLWKFWQGKGRLAVDRMRIVIPANFKGLPPSAVEQMQFAQQEAETEPQVAVEIKDSKATVAKDTEAAMPRVLDVGDYVDVIAEPLASDTYTLRQLTVLNPDQDDVSPQHEATAQGVHLRGQLTEYVPGTIYSLNWVPMGGFVRMLGEEDPTAPDSFAAAPKRWRAAVLLAGPLMNVLLALVLITAAWMSGVQDPVTCQVEITAVGAGTPAAAAGLQPNDVVLKADGQPMDVCMGLTTYVREHGGQQVILDIQRSGQTIQVPVTPRAAGQYDATKEGPLGISISDHVETWTIHRASLPEALSNTISVIAAMVTGILSLPVLLLKGTALSFLGPIGISQAGGEAIEMSRTAGTLFPILMLIGQVSVAVGLTNALPFPALDGGRLLFVLVEWIRGRRIDPRKEMIVHLVGLGLLLIMVAVVSYRDILRIITGQKLF